MKKKMISLVLALVMCLGLCIPAFATNSVTECVMDDVLRGRGYPQIYLDHISITVKESLYNKPGVIFAGGTIIGYDEDTGSFVNYDIPIDGVMPVNTIPSSDMNLVWGVSQYTTSNNILVTFSYEWHLRCQISGGTIL